MTPSFAPRFIISQNAYTALGEAIMGEDDLDNLTKKITGGGEEDEKDETASDSSDQMDERLDDAAVHMKDRSGETLSPREVIETLGTDDPERSADAADELERLAAKEPEILEEYERELLEALEIDDSWAKRAAASALAKVGSEDAVERLEALDLPETNEAAAEIRERHGLEGEEEAEEDAEEDAEASGEADARAEEAVADEGKDYEDAEKTKDEGEEMGTEESETAAQKSASTTDGGSKTQSSAASTGQGRALDAAKNGNADVDFTEIVVLQMLESDKQEPNKYAEESLRYAVGEYPDMAMKLTDSLAERLTDGRDDVRRYASIVMHELSMGHVDEAREYIPEIVESLGDEDDEVSERGQEALTNIAEEYPDEVVGNVAELSKK